MRHSCLRCCCLSFLPSLLDERQEHDAVGGGVAGLYGRMPLALRRQLLERPATKEAALKALAQATYNLAVCTSTTDIWHELEVVDGLRQKKRKAMSHHGALPPRPTSGSIDGSREQWRDPGNHFYESWLDYIMAALGFLRKTKLTLRNLSRKTAPQKRRDRAGDICEYVLASCMIIGGLAEMGNYEDVRWDLMHCANPKDDREAAVDLCARLLTCMLAFEHLDTWVPDQVFQQVLPHLREIDEWTSAGYQEFWKGDRDSKRRSVEGAKKRRDRDAERAAARRAGKRASGSSAAPSGGACATPPLGGGGAASSSAAPSGGACATPPLGGGGAASSSTAAPTLPPLSFAERRAAAQQRLLAPTDDEGDDDMSDWD